MGIKKKKISKKMKINFLTIFVGFYVGVSSNYLQPCTDFKCFNARFEAFVEHITDEYEKVKAENEELKEENEELKNEIGQRIAENENDIQLNRALYGQLKERTDEKEKELIAVESRTTNLEANVVEDDFYYKYKPSSYYAEFKRYNILQFGTKLSGNVAGYYDRYTGIFTGGHFDPATGQFTAPVDGRYTLDFI